MLHWLAPACKQHIDNHMQLSHQHQTKQGRGGRGGEGATARGGGREEGQCTYLGKNESESD